MICSILLLIVICDSGENMGVVRVDDKLIKKVQDWLDRNGNKYKHPSLSAFVNNAIYEKLHKIEANKK